MPPDRADRLRLHWQRACAPADLKPRTDAKGIEFKSGFIRVHSRFSFLEGATPERVSTIDGPALSTSTKIA
jgi:hypothetical protein